jgi:hypothetical protein
MLTTDGEAQVRPDFSSRQLKETAGSRLHSGTGTLVSVKGQGPVAGFQLGVVILLAASACSGRHPKW